MLTLQLTQKYIIFKHLWSLVGVVEEADVEKREVNPVRLEKPLYSEQVWAPSQNRYRADMAQCSNTMISLKRKKLIFSLYFF